ADPDKSKNLSHPSQSLARTVHASGCHRFQIVPAHYNGENAENKWTAKQTENAERQDHPSAVGRTTAAPRGIIVVVLRVASASGAIIFVIPRVPGAARAVLVVKFVVSRHG